MYISDVDRLPSDASCGIPGPQIECVTENYFLISQPKHMLWVLKEPSR